MFGPSNRDIEVKFYKELVTLLAVEKGLVKNVPHDSRDVIFVKEAVVTAALDLDIRKEEYAQICSTERKKIQRESRRRCTCHLQIPSGCEDSL